MIILEDYTYITKFKVCSICNRDGPVHHNSCFYLLATRPVNGRNLSLYIIQHNVSCRTVTEQIKGMLLLKRL